MRRCSISSRRAAFPVGVLGVEYGWLFATGEESKRLFKVFRESCENAVALGCDMLMSAPGQVQGPIKDAIKYLKEAGDIAAEYKLQARDRIQFAARRAQQPACADRIDRGRQQAELRLSDRRLSFHAQRRRRPRLRERAGRQDLLLPVQRPLAQSGHRRAAADRPAAARQRRRQMARDARAAGGKRLYRLSQLRGAQSRAMGALAL